MYFGDLKAMGLKSVSLKMLWARNMRLGDALQGSFEFPGIWYLPWHVGRREEESQCPKSLFTLLPPQPSFGRTYPPPPKPVFSHLWILPSVTMGGGGWSRASFFPSPVLGTVVVLLCAWEELEDSQVGRVGPKGRKKKERIGRRREWMWSKSIIYQCMKIVVKLTSVYN